MSLAQGCFWGSQGGVGLITLAWVFRVFFVCLARVPSVKPCRSGSANPGAVLADSGRGAAFGQCFLEVFGVAFPPVAISWLRFLLVCHGAAFCCWHWNHSGDCVLEAQVSTDFASGTLTAQVLAGGSGHKTANFGLCGSDFVTPGACESVWFWLGFSARS